MWVRNVIGIVEQEDSIAAHRDRRSGRTRMKASGLAGLATALAVVFALLYAAVVSAPAGARGRVALTGRALAVHLAALDPGRPIGGNTVIGSSNGEFLVGVPRRINFIVAIGSDATIVGGQEADQLGALGRNATIDGGGGNDLIHGGPGHDVINGGAGNDLIIDTKGTATIYTGAGRNEVDVAGHGGGHDRVVCAVGSVDRIFANHGDSMSSSCGRAAGSQIAYHRPPSTAPGKTSLAPSANGCTDNPNVDCSYPAAGGSLPGLLWWARTPQRQCPASHPYLQFLDTVPFGSNYPFGVEMKNIGNIGFFAPRLVGANDYVHGAQVGEVTNWTFSEQRWEMVLHCTSDRAHGWRHGGR